MHDFCFTIPYGMAVVLGGLVGFLTKGSTSSLLGGAGGGGLILLGAFSSLNAYKRSTNSYSGLLLETTVALALTFIMGQRYMATSRIMPAGIVASLSAVMALFLLFKLATGGNHVVKKQKEVTD